MIRHFATREDAWRFSALLDYVRPRGFGGRGSTQLTPYTRVIDAARPDPWSGWRMLDRAHRAVAGDSVAGRELEMDFTIMQALHGNLVPARGRAPLAVADALPVADALLDLGRVGSQALRYLNGRSPVPATWRATADSVLNDIDPAKGRSFGLLRPVGAAAVRVLVEAVPRP